MAVYGPARRFAVVAFVLAAFIVLILFRRSEYHPIAHPGLPLLDGQDPGEPTADEPPPPPPPEPEQDVFKLPLPAEYQASAQESDAAALRQLSDVCRDKFSAKLLEDLRARRGQYCAAESSQTALTCFHTVNNGFLLPGSIDSFCLAENGAAFDVARQKFVLDCSLRELSEEESAAGAIPYGEINSYTYLTGPKFLLNHWTDIKGYGQVAAVPPAAQGRKFTILLKREVDGNMFHCLNELMAIMTSLDVLRIAPGAAEDEALFNAADVANTEIVILDEHPDGPYWELFQMFSNSKPLRLAEWIEARKGDSATADDNMIPLDKIIIPLAGSANPLWTEWIDLDCSDSTTLRVFVQRLFDLYGLARARERTVPDAADLEASYLSLLPPKLARRLTVTFVVRKGSRRLMGLDTHLFARAQALFADKADVRLVDFEGMPFVGQMAAARDTDVLVGMHGAGLAHNLFMDEGRGAVVEVQPDRLCHKGFRNLAQMTRTAYYVAGASKAVGNCYPEAGQGEAGVEVAVGDLVPMLDDGSLAPLDKSQCWSYTENPDDWSFACTDPKVTGGEQSYMVCRSHTDDKWYQTCSKKEAADMWWRTRYVIEEEKLMRLVSNAIDEVRRRQAQLD